MEFSKDLFEALTQALGFTNNLILILLALLMLNILSIGLRFYLDQKLKDRESRIFRKNMISKRSIKVQEEIYRKMEALTLYSKGEEHQLLEDLVELQQFVITKRLYISPDLEKLANQILDYFRNLITDYRRKDFKTEQELFNEYSKLFNK